MPEGFRNWTPLPPGVGLVPYLLPSSWPRTADPPTYSARRGAGPDAFLHEEPQLCRGRPDPPRRHDRAPLTSPLRCWAEIDLAALERNLRLIRAALPPKMRYVAVVKADAYGHGLPQAATRLMHAGADLFAVANVAEAAALRELGPGWPILLLSPLLPEEDRLLAEYDLAATVSTPDEVERFDAAGRAAGRPIAVHLKIDTGMGRLGRVARGGARPPREDRRGPAPAASTGSSRISPARTTTPPSPPSSAGGSSPPSARAGASAWRTCSSTPTTAPGSRPCPGRPVQRRARRASCSSASCPTRIAPGRRCGRSRSSVFGHGSGIVKRSRGTTISYGRTHTLCEGLDGRHPLRRIRRRPSAGGEQPGPGPHPGRRCPVLGRVTMDQTIVDVTDSPGWPAATRRCSSAGRGPRRFPSPNSATGPTRSPWETLCSITKRVPRATGRR